MFCFIN